MELAIASYHVNCTTCAMLYIPGQKYVLSGHLEGIPRSSEPYLCKDSITSFYVPFNSLTATSTGSAWCSQAITPW